MNGTTADAPEDFQTTGEGHVLITGPSNTGKTLACARALLQYVQAHGPEGVAVLEFAPEHTKSDGNVVGRRLTQFMPIPEGCLHFVVPTRAPRLESSTPEQAIDIARANAEACQKILTLLPEQTAAIFVNDATMPFHVPGADPGVLLRHLRGANVAVATALDPVDLDAEHPITKQERAVLAALAKNMDKVVNTKAIVEQQAALQQAQAQARGQEPPQPAEAEEPAGPEGRPPGIDGRPPKMSGRKT